MEKFFNFILIFVRYIIPLVLAIAGFCGGQIVIGLIFGGVFIAIIYSDYKSNKEEKQLEIKRQKEIEEAKQFEIKQQKEIERKKASGEYEKELEEMKQKQQKEKELRQKHQKELEEKQRKERELHNSAEEILIDCEGNIYSAIKRFKEKHNVSIDIAKNYINEIEKEFSSNNIKEANNSNNQYVFNTNINVPKCPTCGSTKVEKIGMVSKMISTDLFGLASNSIGKTFKCNNCGHKW